MDSRDKIRDRLIELIDAYGSRKMLAHRVGTTEAYMSMLMNRTRYPSLDLLVDLLHECGYDLAVVMKEENTNDKERG